MCQRRWVGRRAGCPDAGREVSLREPGGKIGNVECFGWRVGNFRKHRADGLNLLSGKGGNIKIGWG